MIHRIESIKYRRLAARSAAQQISLILSMT
jgi:hypothetical protein